MDFFFSIEEIEPDAGTSAAKHYTEKVITQSLANIFYTAPVLDSTPSRLKLQLPEGHLYGCPQTLFKFHPDFDHVMLQILKGDPMAKIVLLEGKFPYWKEIVLNRLKRKSPEVLSRIHWLPALSRSEYIEMLACMDVLLDPFPFGGGNTTLEALAVGTPVVTLPPLFARGRLAHAFYVQMGYTDLITSDPEDYIRTALRLGTDPIARAKASNKIEESRGVLYENMDAVREFEALLEDAHRSVLERQR
jgi:predicted O-linked N-acetylglucosamine transferase (SPINDLY family)